MVETHANLIEDRLAAAILEALRRADPSAFIQGEPASGPTTIDGTFNLEVVARMVLWELRDRLEVRS
jgi:hypothetical protein